MIVDFKAGAVKPLDKMMENAIRTAAALETHPKQKSKKKEKTPTYNFTLEQIQQLKREAVREAAMEVATLTLGFPVMYMKDKEGWGKIRLSRLIDGLLDMMDGYEKGYFALEDVKNALWEEGDLKIERREIWRTKK
jgi:hypothetical protein